MADTPTTNVEKLPRRRPGRTCNARLHRGEGYCDVPAGEGTDHPGIGRCRLHGGETGDVAIANDEVDELFRAAGLDFIIDLAETMRHGDQEYLMEVGNNALVVTRSKILAQLQDPTLTPRELNDLTNSLTRIDNLIAKHPNGVAAEESAGAFENEDEAELARVLKLADGSG